MVVTMLEARVPPEKEETLREAYREVAADGLAPWLLETFLLHLDDSDVWRIVTVWRSREELMEYRASVETPSGVLVFRAAGAEPELKIFEVALRVTE
jgi:heme-degrading monooxygenase HmoA